MSNELDFSLVVRQARSSLFATQINGGKIELYDGTRPTDSDTAITDQVMLASFVLDDPAGTSTNGVWTGVLPPAALIMASGTPTWSRWYDALDATVCDADVGLTGSGQAVEVENDNFVEGAYASLTQLIVVEG